jgi:hypothetical protein
MGAPFHLAGAHRQQRLRAIQGLDLRFFVNAEHRRVRGRIQIQPDDVPHFVDEQRVVRQFEGLTPMRLQAEGAPNPIDGHATQIRGFRHIAHAPVRRATRRRFQRPSNHLFDHGVGNRPRRARPRFVVQPIEAIADKSAAPLTHRCLSHVKAARHALILAALSTRQDDSGPARQEGRRP